MMKGRGGIPGLRSQKDGVLGVDILRAASERSVQVEASWEVVWIFWMAWWGIDGLSLVGELGVCVVAFGIKIRSVDGVECVSVGKRKIRILFGSI